MKEKSLLVAEKELLEDQVSKLRIHVDQLQQRLRSLADKRSSQKDVVSKLEAALEKVQSKSKPFNDGQFLFFPTQLTGLCFFPGDLQEQDSPLNCNF